MGYYSIIIKMLKWSVISTIICCILVVLFYLINKTGKKITIGDAVTASILILVSSLRYDTGSDYIRYMESAAFASREFAGLHDLYNLNTLLRYHLEVGYETLSIITSKISGSKVAIFWMVSIVLYIPLVYYCRKYTADARIAMAIYILFGFWGLSLNIMKQALAMMFVLYAYEFLKSKKYIRFAALSFMSLLFHITAVIALICIMIVHLKWFKVITKPTKRNLGIWVIIGIVLRMGTSAFATVLRHIGIFSQYLFYLEAGNNDRTSRTFILYGALIETVIVTSVLYIAINRINQLTIVSADIEDYISIIMIGLPFSIIGISKTLWLANRFAKFFFLFLLVLVPAVAVSRKIPKGLSNSVLNRSLSLFFKPDLVDNAHTLSNSVLNISLSSFFKPDLVNNTHTLSISVYGIVLIIWHAMYSVLMMDNNQFHIQTYLFGIPQ